MINTKSGVSAPKSGVNKKDKFYIKNSLNYIMQTKKEILSKTKLEFYEEIKKYQSKFKPTKELTGFGSTALVGEKNYPQLKIHNVSNEDKDSSFLKNSDFVKKDYSEIIKSKAKNVLGSTNPIYIKKSNNRITDEITEIYKSKTEVEFVSKFDSELKFNKPVFSNMIGTLGTKNELTKIEVNDNISISKQIETHTQGETKSKNAIIELYEKGFNESQIINLLSLGQFGISINKKLVPTKWTITAYDKAISDHLLNEVSKYKIIENYEIYNYFDKGNNFLVLLIPDTFSFELFEKGDNFEASDYVDYRNKLKYDEPKTAGAFYAGRIGILENLKIRKKQALIIIIRLINNYEIPLGVVFVRESIREAMKKRIEKFNNLKELNEFVLENYNSHYECLIKSQTLIEKKKQKKLIEWS